MSCMPSPNCSTSLRLLTLLFTVITAAAWADAPKPGLDCSHASGDIETLICGDAELAALDHKMDGIFNRAAAKNTGTDLKTLAANQRGWTKGRNDCRKAQDKKRCVVDSYNARIVELQITNGMVEAPPAIGFVCNGDESVLFFATFYNGLDPAAAVFTYGGDQTNALAVRTGSGSKYTAENMEFWEHQGEASVDWYGAKLTCKPRR